MPPWVAMKMGWESSNQVLGWATGIKTGFSPICSAVLKAAFLEVKKQRWLQQRLCCSLHLSARDQAAKHRSYVSTCVLKFQGTGSTASFPHMNPDPHQAWASDPEHRRPQRNLRQPLPMSWLLSFFCSISSAQQPKSLVLDEEFSQHPTLGCTCTTKGCLGSWVLISLIIGTFMVFPAKCPKMWR